MKRILILANDVTTILQFRSELVGALVHDGNEVVVCVPESDRIPEIEALGAGVVSVSVARHGRNPFKDLILYRRYIKIIKASSPDIVLTFTIKPNIYGGMACRKLGVPYIANVTGLGALGKGGLLQRLMIFLYRRGVRGAKCVLFQNESNLRFFEEKKIARGRVRLISGSGVNLERFSYVDYPTDERVNVVFVGRVIKDKGVFELAEAARRLAGREDVHFTVVGDVEYGAENPFSDMENVSCVGFHKDVRPYLSLAHAVILPSYHEGMANVLLEAAASGRPVLASLIPGCRETFIDGVSGIGFAPESSDAVYGALIKLLSLSRDEREAMGRQGRKRMEDCFDRKEVINAYFEEINK